MKSSVMMHEIAKLPDKLLAQWLARPQWARFLATIILFFSGATPLLLSLTAPSPATAETDGTSKSESTKNILFLGDSLTDGLGVSREESYPALIQEMIDRADLSYRVINAGVSGDTTAGGLRRLDWLLKKPVAVLVLALGANDGLRGLPPEETKENLIAIINGVQEKNPEVKVLLTGMLVPPTMGARYESEFRETFPAVARETGVTLLPFLLEGVAAQPEYNLEDGIHPNEQGHRRIAEHVWSALYPLLKGTVGSNTKKNVASAPRHSSPSHSEPRLSARELRLLALGNLLRHVLAAPTAR